MAARLRQLRAGRRQSSDPVARLQAALGKRLADHLRADRAHQLLGVVCQPQAPSHRRRHADLAHRLGAAGLYRTRRTRPPGARLTSPVSGLPCLWYRYRVERRNGDRWEHIESGVSHDTFGVDDGSGLMLVDPEGAEILTSRKQVSTAGDYRKTEWTLLEGETIYVIGEHVSLGGPNAVLDNKTD